MSVGLDGELGGRAALVTGAGRGVGHAVALRLARSGAAVVVNDRDGDAVEAAVAEIVRNGGVARPCIVDITDPAAHELLAPVIGELGIDILVANAGLSSSGKALLYSSIDECIDLFRLNVIATLAIAQLAIPQMRSGRRGDIIVISSASTTRISPKSGPYTIAKAGLEALALTLAKEEARHGIRVNVVAPGLVDTRLGRLVVQRVASAGLDTEPLTSSFISPADVATAVHMLICNERAPVSGQRVEVGKR